MVLVGRDGAGRSGWLLELLTELTNDNIYLYIKAPLPLPKIFSKYRAMHISIYKMIHNSIVQSDTYGRQSVGETGD